MPNSNHTNINNKEMLNGMNNTTNMLVKNAKSNTSERLNTILTNSNGTNQLAPMISLPNSNNYWYVGWKHQNLTGLPAQQETTNEEILSSSSLLSTPSSSCSLSPSLSNHNNNTSNNYNSNLNLNKIGSVTCSLELDSSNEQWYREAFSEKENVSFYGMDISDGPFILSYKIDLVEYVECVRVIFRTRVNDFFATFPLSNLDDPVQPIKIIRMIDPEFRVKHLFPLLNINGYKLLQDFDNHTINKTFKFGVIYMKKGQTTEEELFSNQEHSEGFDQFLDLLGQRIKLKDFTGFRGGLDTAHGQTGEYSIHETFQNKEIMFHVSTLLPYNKNDSQQLERKRHIGNDIVAIVFQEDNTPFAPDMIASNFLHAFIVVQKYTDENTHKTRYRVSVTARKDVPNFGPPLSNDCIYDNDQAFKNWILNKLINAEYACFKAEKFKRLRERTRSSLFDLLYTELHEKNKSVLFSMFPSTIIDNPIYLNHPDSITENGDVHYSFNGNNSSISSHSDLNSHSNNHTTSSTNLNTSSSFKFSILNTVRKAFRKDSKELNSLNGSTSNLSKISQQTTSSSLYLNGTQNRPFGSNLTLTQTLPLSSKTNQPQQQDQTLNNSITSMPNVGRMRSSTFDSGSSLTSNTKASKSSKKVPKLSKSGKNNFKLSSSNIGSIDSLNNLENIHTSNMVPLKPKHSLVSNHMLNLNLNNELNMVNQHMLDSPSSTVSSLNTPIKTFIDLNHQANSFMHANGNVNKYQDQHVQNGKTNGFILHDKSCVSSSSASYSLPEDDIDDIDDTTHSSSVHTDNVLKSTNK